MNILFDLVIFHISNFTLKETVFMVKKCWIVFPKYLLKGKCVVEFPLSKTDHPMGFV